jgi:hypothetical protein
MKQGSPPPTNDPFAQGPVHNDTGFPASTSTHPSSQPSSPDLPYDYEYPSTATSSSFEIEHDSMEDVDVDANTNTNTFTEPANAMDRIRRGISKQYSTVTGRQQFEEEDAFRHARKSTLLSVEVSEQQQQKDPSSRQRQIFLTSVDLDTIEQLDADY